MNQFPSNEETLFSHAMGLLARTTSQTAGLSILPKLERLAFGLQPNPFLPGQPIAEFWKEWDAK